MAGVQATRVGYTGGSTSNPTYQSVCSGDGHSEAVKVVFDPTKVSYEELVTRFYSMHDYSRQSKPQYMSAIFAQNDDQHRVAAEVTKKVKGRVATEIKPPATFYDAEDYHQDYLNKRRFF